MTQAPQIQSVGPPPQRHAERIVDEMLLWMHGQQAVIWERAKGSLNSKQMGNPVGQERAVARFRKALGKMGLEVRLSPGKRGRYHLTNIAWIVWDSDKSDMARQHVAPARPTLALAVFVSERSNKWDSSVPLVVTRHALVRLAERADMRTTEDLIEALRAIWWALFTLVAEKGDGEWASPPPEGWRVQLPLTGAPIAVIGRQEEEPRRMLVKTILAGE